MDSNNNKYCGIKMAKTQNTYPYIHCSLQICNNIIYLFSHTYSFAIKHTKLLSDSKSSY